MDYKGNDLSCIIVRFDDPKCGQQHREMYPVLSQKFKPDNGTTIFRHEFEIQLSSRKGKDLGTGSIAKIHQFPPLINYGSIAHKIQVQNLESINSFYNMMFCIGYRRLDIKHFKIIFIRFRQELSGAFF